MEFDRKHLFLLCALSFLLYFAAASFAAPRYIVKPKVSASWRVDTNYFRAEAIEREVSTFLVRPGIELGMETAKSLVVLDYTLNLYKFEDRDPVPPGQLPADEDNFVGHTGTLSAEYRPSDRLLLGLADAYHRTRNPAYSDVFSNAVEREQYDINRLTAIAFYDFGPRFRIGLRYRNTGISFDREALEDSTEHRGLFDLIYNVTRKSSLDLEYQHWQKDYEFGTSDYTSNQIQLVFRKQFRNFSFEAGGGYHDRKFDNGALQDIDTPVYRVAIIGQNPPAPVTPRSHLSVAAELNFNSQGLGDEYFRANRLTLSAGHVFLEKFPVNITGYYQKSDYKFTFGLTPDGTTARREDRSYDISGSIGYMFTDWLTFSVTAGLEERDSNLAGLSYDNRYFMIKLQFGHVLGTK